MRHHLKVVYYIIHKSQLNRDVWEMCEVEWDVHIINGAESCVKLERVKLLSQHRQSFLWSMSASC